MGFLCVICHEDVSRKDKKVETNDSENVKLNVQERPCVVTKCGHVFHSDCLKHWFEKKGPNAWATKECPTCRMSLTVATDLIRIFTTSADDGSPSIEDYKLRVSKLESAQTLLSNNLEMSFLRGRDQEKKINLMTRDLEKIQKAYILETTKVSQYRLQVAKLSSENEELRNVIINLNKAMTSGNNNNNGMQHPYSGVYNNNGVALYSNGLPTTTTTTTSAGFLDSNSASNNNNNTNNLTIHNNNNLTLGHHQQQQQQLQNQISSWPPPNKPSNNNNNNNSIMTGNNGINMNENLLSLYMINGNNNNNITTTTTATNNNNNNNNSSQLETNGDLSQLNSMFQGIGLGFQSRGASLLTSIYGDGEFKSSTMDENNSSSCLDSDSSRTDSEIGDNNNTMIRNNNSGLPNIYSVNINNDSSIITNNGNNNNNHHHHTNNNSYLTTNIIGPPNTTALTVQQQQQQQQKFSNTISGDSLSSINYQTAAAVTGGSSNMNINSNVLLENTNSINNNLHNHHHHQQQHHNSSGANLTDVVGGGSRDDQIPTEELMNEILNSHSSKSINMDDFGSKKQAAAAKLSKGKTKWKAYEYEDDNNKKMYGKFFCKNCSAKWGTARHVFNQSQTCLKCNETVFPYDQGPVLSREELAQQKLARNRKQ